VILILEFLIIGSFFKTFDNSGSRLIKVINKKPLIKDNNSMYLLFVLVKRAIPHKKVKKGDKLFAIFLKTRFYVKRTNSFVRTNLSLVCLLKPNELLPIANRVFCKVFLELRSIGFFRLILISRGLY